VNVAKNEHRMTEQTERHVLGWNPGQGSFDFSRGLISEMRILKIEKKRK
jgi:hypothetical protein